MKKCLLFILALFSLSINSFSQLDTTTLIPNFDQEDINGNPHNLYDLLNDNKIVLLDFFTVWCEPCWSLHETHILEDLYQEFGPTGTDEFAVISIECDKNTLLEEIYGNGSTQGDWTEGISYPIINDQLVNSATSTICETFEITGYPKLMLVCPDRSFVYLNNSIEEQVQNAIDNCPHLENQNNAMITNYFGPENNICDEIILDAQIEFQNAGIKNLTSVGVLFKYDGQPSYEKEITWYGNLESYEKTNFGLPYIPINEGKISIEIISANGSIDEGIENNNLSIEIYQSKITQTKNYNVEILTDSSGAEIYWAILDNNRDIIADGGNQRVGLNRDITNSNNFNNLVLGDSSAYDSNELINIDVELPADGCYEFIVNDYANNGICCDFGDGYFKLSADSVLIAESTEEFKTKSTTLFRQDESLPNSSVSISEALLNIYPNPLQSELNIQVNQTIIRLSIVNQLGQYMYVEDVEFKEKMSLNIEPLIPGAYWLILQTKNGETISNKFIKQD